MDIVTAACDATGDLLLGLPFIDISKYFLKSPPLPGKEVQTLRRMERTKGKGDSEGERRQCKKCNSKSSQNGLNFSSKQSGGPKGGLFNLWLETAPLKDTK